MQIRRKGKNIGYSCMNPTPRTRILHPILHPKLSVNKRPLVFWCRKCRRFSKTFFVEGEQGCSPESAKHRTSLGKSTDVLPQNYGCFHRRSPMFLFSGKRAEQACSKLCQASDRGRRSQGKQTEAAVWTISEHGIQPSFSDAQKDLPDSDNTKC